MYFFQGSREHRHPWGPQKWHIHDKNLNFLFIKLSVTDFLHYMTSYTFTHYVLLMMTLHNVACWPKHRSRIRDSENFSKT